MSSEIAAVGNKQERELFTEVERHYQTAKEDLDQRRIDFDKKDELFRSYIDETNWPYRSLVFDPRTFTALYEKTARLLANKPRGRMIPREGGDSLGAKINNELLSFQWDDNERVDNTPMLARWALMDLNARKYGASFALVKWHWQRQVQRRGKDSQTETGKSIVYFDGPNFKPLDNRDCLANPSYSTVKNWFQHREYVTFQELADINDASRGKPIYKNLDFLVDQMKSQGNESRRGGDRRDTNYVVKNKAIKSLTDYLGTDEVYRTIEIVTEYRPDRWITFSPKHGIILRDIPNPYDHGQIPVVQLKYYPIDDDLYGLSEIEPIEKLQKATNAIVCQYLDAINMSLYAPLKVRQTGGAVQIHTLQFGPGSKWLMNDPATDVVTHDQNITGVSEFTSTYRFMISAMMEALGEASQGVSGLSPGESDKTATEIKDSAMQRNARDNFNQIFLAEAIKKQHMFWHAMNQQLLFSNPQEQTKIIRIVGKDAIQYFQQMGLDGEALTDESIDVLSDPELADTVQPQDLTQPMYPVQMGGETMPKLVMEEDGQFGSLVLEPEDLAGNYDFIPDIESMRLADDTQLIAAKKQMIELALNPVTSQLLMQDGYRLKVKDIMEDFFEQLQMKDADKYFEKLQQNQNPMMGGVYGDQGVQADQAGAGVAGQVPPGMANGGMQGVQGGVQAVSGGQAQPVVS